MDENAHWPLLEAIKVVEKLRAPGGCPWDRQQTHESLVRFMVEEVYETIAAIDDRDPVAMRDELGDVLLQVLMHATIAAEHGDFGIDDIAENLTAKMIARHPHVFGDGALANAEEVEAAWEERKAQEMGSRRSILDGIPRGLPSLIRAGVVARRKRYKGPERLVVSTDTGDSSRPDPSSTDGAAARLTEELVGTRLFDLVAESAAAGIDADAALRQHLDRLVAEANGGDSADRPRSNGSGGDGGRWRSGI